jgi:membrane carboxypeptidase/penicillin-binding protein PbpC
MNSDKKEVYDEWGRLLTALEKQDGYYKDWLREHLTHINQKYQEIVIDKFH